MPEIRIYLLTCRRAHLLPRALRSLLAQTHTDWVCELHNDAPEDDEPRRVLAAEAGSDPRFVYQAHARNLGAVTSFNLAFQPIAEPFAAILEDDNWWEPGFLAGLKATLEAEPDAVAAWANLRIHEEQADGRWLDTGRTVWAVGQGRRRFNWPDPRQMLDALHSQGALLFRAGAQPPQPVPAATPLAQIEPVRERGLARAIVLDERPLGHFALTRTTARSSDRLVWLQGQMLVAGSFLAHVPLSSRGWAGLWRQLQLTRPRNTNLFLLLALAGVARPAITGQARLADWLHLAAAFLRHPRLHCAALSFRSRHRALWDWLDREAGLRTAEARRRGFTELDVGPSLAKNPPGAAP